jgi:hypothetical protein
VGGAEWRNSWRTGRGARIVAGRHHAGRVIRRLTRRRIVTLSPAPAIRNTFRSGLSDMEDPAWQVTSPLN